MGDLIWALIVFNCHSGPGYTAKCYPTSEVYDTRDQCVNAMTIPGTSLFGLTLDAPKLRSDAMCLPLSGQPVTAKGPEK